MPNFGFSSVKGSAKSLKERGGHGRLVMFKRHRFRPGLPVLFAFFFQNGQRKYGCCLAHQRAAFRDIFDFLSPCSAGNI
jgi:hypothetical protein